MAAPAAVGVGSLEVTGEPQLTFGFTVPELNTPRAKRGTGKAAQRAQDEAHQADLLSLQPEITEVEPSPEAPTPQLFDDRIGLDIHLASSHEAIASVTGGQSEWVAHKLGQLTGGVRPITARKLAFPAGMLDRLLCVARPHDVTLDAAALCVARALWAQELGWRPLRVHRRGRRLLASSVRWPTGWRVVDAPWTSVLALEALGIPLEIEDSAKALLMRKLADSGQHIAEAGLAGSAVLLYTERPDLLEEMQLPALAYAGIRGNGRYRIPLLAAAPLLDEPTIKCPPQVEAAIRRATAPIKPLAAPEGFPRTLYPFQAKDLAIGMRIAEHTGGVLFAGEMGSGKALPVTAKLYTPFGPRPIGEVVVGDAVLGSDGETHLVTGVYLQGLRPMYRVVFTDKTSVVCDENHLWSVSSSPLGSHGGSGRVLSVQQILAEALQNEAGNLNHYIPLISAPLEMEIGLPRPVSPYILGALLIYGRLTGTEVGLTDAEGEVAALIRTEISASSLTGVLVQQYDRKYYDISDPTDRVSQLKAGLEELGVWGKRAWEQSVPATYLYGPPEVRLAVLQGVLDTAGGVVNQGGGDASLIEFSSTSEQLIEDVCWLVQSLGGTACKAAAAQNIYTYNGEKKSERESWRLSIVMPDMVIPFRCSRKQDEYEPREKYLPARGIVSIEPEGVAEAVCISVDAPDQLYVTEHAILTHNTTVSLAMIDHLEAWPLLVVAPLAAFSTWERQVAELGRSVRLCKNSIFEDAAALDSVDCAIVSYDRLHRFLEPLERGGFAAIIADEIQRIRTPGSRRSRALRALAGAVPLRVGLSGTPVTNRAEDVLPLGAFLIPGEWRPRLTNKDLADLYPGEDPLDALAEHLGTMMVRRRIEDVGVKLPGRTVIQVPVTLSPEQRRALRDMEEEALAAKHSGELGNQIHVFARLQKMRQIVNAPNAAGLSGPNAKVAAAVELAVEYSDAGRKSVIFVADRPAWREVGERLDALKIGWTGIWGSTSIDDRIANEAKFHSDDSIRVFVGTLAACAESLTLSPTATVTIFASLSYSPSAIAQAAARAYRLNQTNDVDELYLHATAPGGTIDDRMQQILEEKRRLIAQIVDRTEHVDRTQKVSMADLLYMLTGERDDPEAQARLVAKTAKLQLAEADAASEMDLVARRKRHARATIYARKTGEFLDDGAAAQTREEWEAAHGRNTGWLEAEEARLAADADDEDDWTELLDDEADEAGFDELETEEA